MSGINMTIYDFREAPEELCCLSENGGDEDEIFVLRNKITKKGNF
jgi:hypothetical protein